MSRSYIDLGRGESWERVWLDGDGTAGHSGPPGRRMDVMRRVRSRLHRLQRQATVCIRFLQAAKAGRWQREDRKP